ncbi:MAG: anthranilate phosphoribosyltransferase [Gemmatimonadales bacterium]|nr:anthranilate phosphoribosyltransferase [Gemmatimonadales bacterium]NIN11645.1 anthranilate phosphoribosyltransferase [Gemmatimonadales bacterium]NIN50251.1 anthranilate phosphoribosyltransferase [Gemmatimonadales bacterium]NIP07715.1 anthranilate phosphoribosyltransferase [Gemmatimonadales bacterium]NIQ99118.1 anthranilate phosphoribosyltransferase [Gemmatimonadales bacterium]
MDAPVARALRSLADGRRLGESLTQEAFGQVMLGEATPAQVGALLLGLRVQVETADEITGAVKALRAAMVRVEVADRSRLVDTCGTGGGAITTFNISTAAALVAVGAGAVVAKHGNRSYTSQCGSADVLQALGIPIATDSAGVTRLLERAGMAFLFAPAFHPAMRHVAPVRRELAIATIMNVIGPLANPAGVSRQLLGVADPERAPVIAEALRRLGAEHALVVHGTIGMDEIAPTGSTAMWEVHGGQLRNYVIDPSSYDLRHDDIAALAGGEPAENAARVTRLLLDPGSDPAGRAAVALNAGAAVYVAGLGGSLQEGIEQALTALEEGRGASALERLKRESGVSTSE